jgi:hypothetical protein
LARVASIRAAASAAKLVSTIGAAPPGLTAFCTGFFVVFFDAVDLVVALLTALVLFGVVVFAALVLALADLVVAFFVVAFFVVVFFVVVFFALGFVPLLLSLAI